MSQFNTISIVNIHIFTLFMLLIIFANNHSTSANTIRGTNDYLPRPSMFHDSQSILYVDPDNLSYEPVNDETSSSRFWSRLFRPNPVQPNYIQTIPDFDLRRGVIHIVPYKKRTIPLDLQKALYAHGIVGRRR